MTSLAESISVETEMSTDEALSEVAWMLKSDGLFDHPLVHLKLDAQANRLETYLNFKHTFPLCQQQHGEYTYTFMALKTKLKYHAR